MTDEENQNNELVQQLESDVETNLDEITQQVTDQQVKQTVYTLDAQKKHWREKHNKLNEVYNSSQEEIKKLKETLGALDKNQQSGSLNIDDLETKVNLRLEGYSKDEIDYMFSYAKGTNRKITDIVKDPFVLAGIDGLRTKAKVEQATPPASNKIGVLGRNEPVNFAKLNPSAQKEQWKTILDKQKSKSLNRQSI